MKKTLLVLALFASLAIAPSAFACSPAMDWPPSASENLARKDVAFIGTVKSIVQDKSANAPYRITFTVDETYKGSLEETVMVETRFSSAACGYDDGYETFEKGTVWAIYANGNAADGYSTDSLSLNTSYKSVSAAENALEKLGLLPASDEEPTMCTMQYAPVCGKDANGNEKTYGNSCTLGAEKGTFVHDGECKADTAMPTNDLWTGMRGDGVTWLQEFLIKKVTGAAASALGAVGSTGYFGSLTTAALAEFQSAHGILPASGYFGAKTRAFIGMSEAPAATASFTGTISAVDTACFADGICSVTIGGKKVIVLAGYRTDTAPPLGSLKGTESIGDLEKEIGSKAEVYAAKTTEGGNDYTLYGNTSFYVKVLAD
jgi:peptidoglycan hydrolase-like protein with peptidoglycan-binding domain